MPAKLLTALPTVLLCLLLPAAAEAARCVADLPGGPRCHLWTGEVAWVADGDTIAVRLDGTPRSRKPVTVRITGIQAMELSSYKAASRRGECHAVEATERLEALIRRSRGKVRLTAQDPTAQSQRRPLRRVAVRLSGRWKDVGRILVREGLVLWWANPKEWASNDLYGRLTQQAAARRAGIFNGSACGTGPSEQPIQVWAQTDADGVDAHNPEGEWIKVRNADPVEPLPLGGWWVRDSGLRRYVFPDWLTLPPGGVITVNVGTADDSEDTLFWGMRRPVFKNHNPRTMIGDGAYLFDPDGDLRAWMMYPCRGTCADPLQGKVEITVRPLGRERIDVRNVSAEPIDLQDRQLVAPPRSYDFAAPTVLQPGETLRLWTGGSPADDTALERHWGFDRGVLRDKGGVARLSRYDLVTLGCASWGDREC